ncbi:O-acetyl-ADP-ribose deacetylase [Dechloromonas sp. XY25]|uniref:O-acetyl-ADP-ribose deacetylase n=1 Tax=Dechloromonas hankyongensis TaxID=2908002 RepID=A0ABS9K2T7_9RHOO|nr:O-acetyl-ADP-ribose deacetylase [Dechloromonas hankyongensis]MCG2577497.1 O-acetyl-ADP-ribose deacetylase [Dechloromonas hankyongensis]
MPPEVTQYLDGRVRLYVGDLTEHAVDAIVNAANSSLLGGGGVDGAIHRRGGAAILDACRKIRQHEWPDGLPTGEVVMTTGGLLPARYVIHTVGPIYGRHAGKEAALLAACYRNALELAARNGLRTLALPGISTGVYGYPAEEAATIVSRTLSEAIPLHPGIAEVRLVFFNRQQCDVFVGNQQFAA